MVKYLKTEIFSVSIGRALIECQSRKVEARLEKSRNFQSIENYTRLIEILENWIFEKTRNSFAESIFKRFFMTCNTWAWFHKFSKKWVFNQELQNEVFYHQKHKFCQPLNIFCIKHHKKYNLGWPIQIHTQFHVLSLAKNNLCSVCN